ncbi:NADH-specific enoyl-ACP reductase [Candidatus Marinamargulisbacteria bacterium SCGC AG-343-D04]|nr:NADH-specific enoyl-ACP reductase [Candidatus Marinamargulisbacteria bacterium SCGC AG-343-D04]
MTQLMKGKKGIVFGVSNKRGIAYAIAKQLSDQGADIAFTYANEVMESRVKPIAEEMNSKLVLECDVSKEDHIEKVFKAYKKTYGTCDFVIHAVAFANREDLMGDFSDVNKEGWDLALGVSAYSLVAIARHAKSVMSESGSILALTYLGGEKYVPNYNVMGVAKAALECSVRYLASEFGEIGVRVNSLSAGPVKTLAFKGIAGSDILLRINKVRSPLKRNITLEDVGKAGLYLCSDLSSGVTGETHHVDSGVHCVAISKEDAKQYENIDVN